MIILGHFGPIVWARQSISLQSGPEGEVSRKAPKDMASTRSSSMRIWKAHCKTPRSIDFNAAAPAVVGKEVFYKSTIGSHDFQTRVQCHNRLSEIRWFEQYPDQHWTWIYVTENPQKQEAKPLNCSPISLIACRARHVFHRKKKY